MKGIPMLLRTGLACGICSLCPMPSHPAPTLAEEYLGLWVLAEVDEGGRVLKTGESETHVDTVQITKDAAEFSRAGGLVKVQYRVSKQKDMWHVDFVFAKKGADERANHAIMRMSGKDLQICVSEKFRANGEKDRPVEFSTDDGKGNKDLNGLILFTYRRK